VGHFEGAKVPNFDEKFFDEKNLSEQSSMSTHPIRTTILSEKATYNFEKFGKT